MLVKGFSSKMSAGRASVVCQDLHKCLGGWIQEWHVLRVGPRERGMKSSHHSFRRIYLFGTFLWEKGTWREGLRLIRNAKCLPYCMLNVWLRRAEQPLSLQEYVFAAQNCSPTTLRKGHWRSLGLPALVYKWLQVWLVNATTGSNTQFFTVKNVTANREQGMCFIKQHCKYFSIFYSWALKTSEPMFLFMTLNNLFLKGSEHKECMRTQDVLLLPGSSVWLSRQGLAEALKGPCSAHCGNRLCMYKTLQFCQLSRAASVQHCYNQAQHPLCCA
ncbi:hypothetical protein EK904_006774 [Melospiza melodia maxima]|nr:hypothetical protein EK904_006774 [Melospiza melodia maxima]